MVCSDSLGTIKVVLDRDDGDGTREKGGVGITDTVIVVSSSTFTVQCQYSGSRNSNAYRTVNVGKLVF